MSWGSRIRLLPVAQGVRGPEGQRLKELEKENARLKRAVADLTLDRLILKEATGRPELAPNFE